MSPSSSPSITLKTSNSKSNSKSLSNPSSSSRIRRSRWDENEDHDQDKERQQHQQQIGNDDDLIPPPVSSSSARAGAGELVPLVGGGGRGADAGSRSADSGGAGAGSGSGSGSAHSGTLADGGLGYELLGSASSSAASSFAAYAQLLQQAAVAANSPYSPHPFHHPSHSHHQSSHLNPHSHHQTPHHHPSHYPPPQSLTRSISSSHHHLPQSQYPSSQYPYPSYPYYYHSTSNYPNPNPNNPNSSSSSTNYSTSSASAAIISAAAAATACANGGSGGARNATLERGDSDNNRRLGSESPSYTPAVPPSATQHSQPSTSTNPNPDPATSSGPSISSTSNLGFERSSSSSEPSPRSLARRRWSATATAAGGGMSLNMMDMNMMPLQYVNSGQSYQTIASTSSMRPLMTPSTSSNSNSISNSNSNSGTSAHEKRNVPGGGSGGGGRGGGKGGRKSSSNLNSNSNSNSTVTMMMSPSLSSPTTTTTGSTSGVKKPNSNLTNITSTVPNSTSLSSSTSLSMGLTSSSSSSSLPSPLISSMTPLTIPSKGSNGSSSSSNVTWMNGSNGVVPATPTTATVKSAEGFGIRGGDTGGSGNSGRDRVTPLSIPMKNNNSNNSNNGTGSINGISTISSLPSSSSSPKSAPSLQQQQQQQQLLQTPRNHSMMTMSNLDSKIGSSSGSSSAALLSQSVVMGGGGGVGGSGGSGSPFSPTGSSSTSGSSSSKERYFNAENDVNRRNGGGGGSRGNCQYYGGNEGGRGGGGGYNGTGKRWRGKNKQGGGYWNNNGNGNNNRAGNSNRRGGGGGSNYQPWSYGQGNGVGSISSLAMDSPPNSKDLGNNGPGSGRGRGRSPSWAGSSSGSSGKSRSQSLGFGELENGASNGRGGGTNGPRHSNSRASPRHTSTELIDASSSSSHASPRSFSTQLSSAAGVGVGVGMNHPSPGRRLSHHHQRQQPYHQLTAHQQEQLYWAQAQAQAQAQAVAAYYPYHQFAAQAQAQAVASSSSTSQSSSPRHSHSHSPRQASLPLVYLPTPVFIPEHGYANFITAQQLAALAASTGVGSSSSDGATGLSTPMCSSPSRIQTTTKSPSPPRTIPLSTGNSSSSLGSVRTPVITPTLVSGDTYDDRRKSYHSPPTPLPKFQCLPIEVLERIAWHCSIPPQFPAHLSTSGTGDIFPLYTHGAQSARELAPLAMVCRPFLEPIRKALYSHVALLTEAKSTAFADTILGFSTAKDLGMRLATYVKHMHVLKPIGVSSLTMIDPMNGNDSFGSSKASTMKNGGAGGSRSGGGQMVGAIGWAKWMNLVIKACLKLETFELLCSPLQGLTVAEQNPLTGALQDSKSLRRVGTRGYSAWAEENSHLDGYGFGYGAEEDTSYFYSRGGLGGSGTASRDGRGGGNGNGIPQHHHRRTTINDVIGRLPANPTEEFHNLGKTAGYKPTSILPIQVDTLSFTMVYFDRNHPDATKYFSFFVDSQTRPIFPLSLTFRHCSFYGHYFSRLINRVAIPLTDLRLHVGHPFALLPDMELTALKQCTQLKHLEVTGLKPNNQLMDLFISNKCLPPSLEFFHLNVTDMVWPIHLMFRLERWIQDLYNSTTLRSLPPPPSLNGISAAGSRSASRTGGDHDRDRDHRDRSSMTTPEGSDPSSIFLGSGNTNEVDGTSSFTPESDLESPISPTDSSVGTPEVASAEQILMAATAAASSSTPIPTMTEFKLHTMSIDLGPRCSRRFATNEDPDDPETLRGLLQWAGSLDALCQRIGLKLRTRRAVPDETTGERFNPVLEDEIRRRFSPPKEESMSSLAKVMSSTRLSMLGSFDDIIVVSQPSSPTTEDSFDSAPSPLWYHEEIKDFIEDPRNFPSAIPHRRSNELDHDSQRSASPFRDHNWSI